MYSKQNIPFLLNNHFDGWFLCLSMLALSCLEHSMQQDYNGDRVIAFNSRFEKLSHNVGKVGKLYQQMAPQRCRFATHIYICLTTTPNKTLGRWIRVCVLSTIILGIIINKLRKIKWNKRWIDQVCHYFMLNFVKCLHFGPIQKRQASCPIMCVWILCRWWSVWPTEWYLANVNKQLLLHQFLHDSLF